MENLERANRICSELQVLVDSVLRDPYMPECVVASTRATLISAMRMKQYILLVEEERINIFAFLDWLMEGGKREAGR